MILVTVQEPRLTTSDKNLAETIQLHEYATEYAPRAVRLTAAQS